MSKLTQAIQSANAQGRKALIPYLPAGFPDMERFWSELKALDDGGADIIEVGVPFTDPVADGPVIEAASQGCLERGVTLAWILDNLKARAGQYKAPLVLMGYYNPFCQYGLQRLAQDSVAGGVAGFIVPDLPSEESEPFRAVCQAAGLDLIPLVGLNTSAERMGLYATAASGFAYFVSVLGTTGVRESLPSEVVEQLRLARRTFQVPVAIGFGIKGPDSVKPFGELIDAAVVGSALVKHIQDGGTAADYMARWR